MNGKAIRKWNWALQNLDEFCSISQDASDKRKGRNKLIEKKSRRETTGTGKRKCANY